MSIKAGVTEDRNLINLTLIPGEQLDGVLSLWDSKLNFNYQNIPSLSDNPLQRFLVKNTAPSPVRAIISSTRKHFKVFGVLESPYLDLEFWDSHTGFYGASFTDYPKECFRLHFFSGSEEEGAGLIPLLSEGKTKEEIFEELKSLAYRGYTIFRPTPSFVVGRTAIEFDKKTQTESAVELDLVPEEKNGIPFLKCWQSCSVNLLNAKFTIQTPEFIQQDPNLGQCATASLWVVSNIMAKKFGTHHFRYGAINQQALDWIGGGNAPNVIFDSFSEESGLSVTEIVKALSFTGANALIATPSNAESNEAAFLRILHEVYSFIESGLPVLFCIENSENSEGHVVASVGHSLPNRMKIEDFIPVSKIGEIGGGLDLSRHFLVSSLVRLYYAHDDSYGPFNRIQIGTRGSIPEKKDESKTQDLPQIPALLGRLQRSHFLRTAIMPAPMPARTFAWPQIGFLLPYFQERYGKEIQNDCSDVIFLWRSLLVSGAQFKRSVCDRNYSPSLKKWYGNLHLPKYVWLYEISITNEKNLDDLFPDKGKRKIAGEFLFDATCPSNDTILLSERVGGDYRDHCMPIGEFYGKDLIADSVEYECFLNECNPENPDDKVEKIKKKT